MREWLIVQLVRGAVFATSTLIVHFAVARCGPTVIVAWAVSGVAWIIAAQRARAALPFGSPPAALFPLAVALQVVLDIHCRYVGDALYVLAHLMAITWLLRTSDFPTARARLRRPRCSNG